MVIFLQNFVNALQWGSFYALIALGYSMVYSILMLFNFAHGDIFMVGAYIGFGVSTAILAICTAGSIGLPNWLILVLTIIISMFLTSFVGVLVERIGYRPLRDAPRASAAITGLMIGIILETAVLAILGPQRVKFPSVVDTMTYDMGGVFVTNKKIMIVLVSLVQPAPSVHQEDWWGWPYGLRLCRGASRGSCKHHRGVTLPWAQPRTGSSGSGTVRIPTSGSPWWKSFVLRSSEKGSILELPLRGFCWDSGDFCSHGFPSTLRDLYVHDCASVLVFDHTGSSMNPT
jgi:hypothetical protein